MSSFYPPLKVRRLGILLRAHREARWLPRIFKQFSKLSKYHEVWVCASLDRPSAEVITAFSKFEKHVGNRPNLHLVYHEPLAPVISAEHGERWSLNLQDQYECLLAECAVQACMVWDDDQVFSAEGLREIRGHLSSLEADRLEVLSLFMWETENQYNSSMLSHWSTILFRVYPGDAFPKRFVHSATERVSRSPHVIQLQWPLPNYGLMDHTARMAAWERARAAGRIDAFTSQFIAADPPLEVWQSQDLTHLLSARSESR